MCVWGCTCKGQRAISVSGEPLIVWRGSLLSAYTKAAASTSRPPCCGDRHAPSGQAFVRGWGDPYEAGLLPADPQHPEIRQEAVGAAPSKGLPRTLPTAQF